MDQGADSEHQNMDREVSMVCGEEVSGKCIADLYGDRYRYIVGPQNIS